MKNDKAEQPALDEDQAHYKQVIDGVRKVFDVKRDEQPAQQQEPVAWMPIEQMYPQAKAIDILMGDGSILCAVLPQFDGDLWWEGSGTGEKFIDPKYANVTHWRIHDERTSPQPAPVVEPHKQQEPAPGYCKHCKQYTVEEQLPAQEDGQQKPKKDLLWATVAMQERYEQRIQKAVATLERIKQEQEPHMVVTVNHKQVFVEGLNPQHQQEPVAWRWTESNGRHWFDWRTDWTHHDRAKAMGFAIEYAYTSPPASKPLTDGQAEAAFKAWHYKHGNNTQGIKWVDDLLRSCWKAAIEAAHKIGVNK